LEGEEFIFEETILNLPFSTLHFQAGASHANSRLPKNGELKMRD
jgi:hypothetical protein